MSSLSYSVETRFPHPTARLRHPDGTAMSRVHDGDLVVLAPLPRERGVGLVLLTLAMFPIFAALGAKSLLLARLDPTALAEMLARLEGMGAMGRALAWLLQPEAASMALSQALAGAFG